MARRGLLDRALLLSLLDHTTVAGEVRDLVRAAISRDFDPT
jgi:hypothetical protein